MEIITAYATKNDCYKAARRTERQNRVKEK